MQINVLTCICWASELGVDFPLQATVEPIWATLWSGVHLEPLLIGRRLDASYGYGRTGSRAKRCTLSATDALRQGIAFDDSPASQCFDARRIAVMMQGACRKKEMDSFWRETVPHSYTCVYIPISDLGGILGLPRIKITRSTAT